MLAAIVGIVAFVVGVVLGGRGRRRGLIALAKEADRRNAVDQASYLKALRRELGGALMVRDPEGYLATYRGVFEEVVRLLTASKEDRAAKLREITARYPLFSDFDQGGDWDWVPSTDAFDLEKDEEVAQRYRDIVLYTTLRSKDDGWEMASLPSRSQLGFLEEYVRRYKDSQLLYKCLLARREYEAAEDSRRTVDPEARTPREEAGVLFRNDRFSVHRVHHFAENRLGFHFHESDEYAVAGTFVSDDMKLFQSFYRSSPGFSTAESLDYLHARAVPVSVDLYTETKSQNLMDGLEESGGKTTLSQS